MVATWVALGGALGALARFGIGGWVTTGAYTGFPWGTFAVNVIGSTALGYLARTTRSPFLETGSRAFFTAGLCGGFTTFSTFDFETLTLLQASDYATAALYSSSSVAVCMIGVAVGMWLAQRPRGAQRAGHG